MTNDLATLTTMYRSFNARDIDGVLDALHEDVEWANGLEGGHVQGKPAIREYWTRQWSEVSPTVDPVAFVVREDGSVFVEVRQTLHDLAGLPIAAAGGLHTQLVGHRYRFSGGKVMRFDVDAVA